MATLFVFRPSSDWPAANLGGREAPRRARKVVEGRLVGWVSNAQPTYLFLYKFPDLIEAPVPNYRRFLVPGGTFFFTVVTENRAPTFHDPRAVRLLGAVMREVRSRRPFHTIAIVVLPDHLHCVWSLPRGDADYSGRWRWIKGEFTEAWLAAGGCESGPSASRARKAERGVWQRRLWEHQIRDEVDLERHVDYVHYNPVKHGHAARPGDWPWSSFPRHARLGQYPADWGVTEPTAPTVTARE